MDNPATNKWTTRNKLCVTQQLGSNVSSIFIQMALQKGRHLPTKLDGVTSHKPAILSATLVRTSFRFKLSRCLWWQIYVLDTSKILLSACCPGDVATFRCAQILTNIAPVPRISASHRLHSLQWNITSFVRKQFPLFFAVCIIVLSWSRYSHRPVTVRTVCATHSARTGL